jgi:hypothetical protein
MSQADGGGMPSAYTQPRSSTGYISSELNSAYPPYAQNMSMTSTASYQPSNNPAGFIPSAPLSTGSSYPGPSYPPSSPAWSYTPQSYQPSSSSVATAPYGQVQTSSYTTSSSQQQYGRDDDIYDKD